MFRTVLAVVIAVGLACQANADLPRGAVASVNGVVLKEADLARLNWLLQTSAKPAGELESVSRLVDRQLMRAFLKKQKVTVPDEYLDLAWQQIELLSGEGKIDLAAELKKAGLTEADLREELWLPLAWTEYVKQTVTADELTARFNKERIRFSGGTRNVRHLVVLAGPDKTQEQVAAAERKINRVRAAIASGEVTFAQAAQKESESPSGAKGGDIGPVHYKGDLPAAVAEQVFALPLNELSQVVMSPFGFHLVVAESERPGLLTLSDVRPAVLEAIGRDRWTSTLEELRKTAKIETRSPGRDRS